MMKISEDYPKVRKLKRSLDKKRLRLAAARARYYARRAKAEGGVSRLGAVRGGGKADREAILADLADCRTEMDSAGQLFAAELARTKDLLEAVGDPVNEALLSGVLIEGDGLQVLRHSLGMSKQGVYSRARSALKELEDMMEEDGYGESDNKGT